MFHPQSIRLRGIARSCDRAALHAAVFGSLARGEADPSSDVDFLVEFESGRTLLDPSGLVIELREALGRDVDVVTRNALHPKLRDAILSEAVPIWSATPRT